VTRVFNPSIHRAKAGDQQFEICLCYTVRGKLRRGKEEREGGGGKQGGRIEMRIVGQTVK
jgi:hypothetical protein